MPSAKPKPTDAEIGKLVSAAEKLVGADKLVAALAPAIGPIRAARLVSSRAAIPWTKADTEAAALALYPLIPGTTAKAKRRALTAALRPCFATQARYEEVYAYVLAVLAEWLNGEPAAVAAPVTSDGFLRFYGRVNLWCAGGEYELQKDVTLCAILGVGYQIEMAGWNPGQTAFDSEANLTAIIAMYRKLHGWCKSSGIPLFVSLTNWNITISKYGNKGRPFASVVPAAKRLAQCVKDCSGQEFVYVQPVAETGNDKSATDFERWCGSYFAGWKLVYNGGSRPIKPAYGWPHFAVHPNKASDGGVKGGISISDTGTIIKQLAADGTLNGPGNPAAISAWFAKCKAAGAIGSGYYAFQRAKHDAAAIKACAAAQVSGNSGQVAAGGNIIPSQVKWLGTSYAKAKTTVTLTDVKMSGTHLNFNASAIDWPPQGAKKCKAVGFLIRKIGNDYVGGKVEWCVVERGWYDVKTNVEDGYNGSTLPANGETCWAGLGHPTGGSECSTLVPFVWTE